MNSFHLDDKAYENVKRDYITGTKVEKWIELSLRSNFSDESIVVKLTDRASLPHKYEDIKDIPSTPDLNVFNNSYKELMYPAEIWITHKLVKPPHKWKIVRNKWLSEMYWKVKTIKSMKSNHWLIYAIYQDSYPESYEPLELILCHVGNKKDTRLGKYWGGWDPVNGGKVQGLNMIDSISIFSDAKWTTNKLSAMFKESLISSIKYGFHEE